VNLHPRFIERRTMFPNRGQARPQLLIRRSDTRALPLRLVSASEQ
jgi:hypothetical protein